MHAACENVRPARDAASMIPERLVRVRLRTVLSLLLTIVSVAVVLEVLWIARHVLTWVFISLFLALALNPAVEWLQRKGVKGRGTATAITYLIALAVVVAIGFTFIPTLVNQVNDFVQKLPDYVHDVTHGRGRLGFLETKYHIQERIESAVRKGGASRVLGFSGVAVSVAKSVITIVVATITIAFMTYFMLLEGPAWVERFYGLLPDESEPRWRNVGREIYQTVGGYVTGNLLISVIAGGLTTIVLLIMGVPFAIALGLIVAILDLIPLAGATIAAILIGVVAFLHSIPAGIVVVVFFIVYQQIENHLLQPLVYGRTVQLSPLVVLISVLIGAELGGILGALGAIPVAGSIQVLVNDYLAHRGERREAAAL
jgi:predicted PurR-regulated permease PerM